MEREFDLSPSEMELEKRLGAISMNVPEIDEHAIWFEAGLRRGRRAAHWWQGAAGCLAAACVMLSVVNLGRRQPANAPTMPSIAMRTVPPTSATETFVPPIDIRRDFAVDRSSANTEVQPALRPADAGRIEWLETNFNNQKKS